MQASETDGNSQRSDPWQFQVNIYGWFPDAPATIKVKGQEVVDVPEDLSTILDSLDGAAMFELQARKGKITLFANTVYYEGSYGENLPDRSHRRHVNFRLKKKFLPLNTVLVMK
ncbi:MAG: hypothetical protein V7725_01145 [Porticoccus sp.]